MAGAVFTWMYLCREGQGEGETGMVEKLAWAMPENGEHMGKDCSRPSLQASCLLATLVHPCTCLFAFPLVALDIHAFRDIRTSMCLSLVVMCLCRETSPRMDEVDHVRNKWSSTRMCGAALTRQ